MKSKNNTKRPCVCPSTRVPIPSLVYVVMTVSLFAFSACQATPEAQGKAEAMLVEAKEMYAKSIEHAKVEAAALLSRAKAEATKVSEATDREASETLAKAKLRCRKIESRARELASATRIKAQKEGDRTIESARAVAAAEAQKEADMILTDANTRSAILLANAKRAVQRIKDESAVKAKEFIATIIQASVRTANSTSLKDKKLQRELEAATAGILKSCSRDFSELLPQLEREQASIRESLEVAKGESKELAGGLLKTLTTARIGVLELSTALVQQRIQALKSGARVSLVTNVTRPEPKRAAKIRAEIVNTLVSINTAEADSERYSGGLIKSMIDAKIATAKVTLAMLQQGYFVAALGLHVPKLGLDPRIAKELDRSKTADIKLRSHPIQIRLLSKAFKKADFLNGTAKDKIALKFSFKNQLPKSLRAFTGHVVFSDLFDREILRVNLTQDDAVRAGRRVTWEGGIDYNMFKAEHQRLRNVAIKNLKVRFVLQRVIYADGKVEVFKK